MDNIRIVNISGKYKLFYCDLDEDGHVEYIRDEVDIRADNFGMFIELLEGINNARKKSCIIINAGNKKEFMRGD